MNYVASGTTGENPEFYSRVSTLSAVLESKGWTVMTFGRSGYEQAWSKLRTRKEVFLPWENYNHQEGTVIIDSEGPKYVRKMEGELNHEETCLLSRYYYGLMGGAAPHREKAKMVLVVSDGYDTHCNDILKYSKDLNIPSINLYPILKYTKEWDESNFIFYTLGIIDGFVGAGSDRFCPIMGNPDD